MRTGFSQCRCMRDNRIGMGKINHDIAMTRQFGNIGIYRAFDTRDFLPITCRATSQNGVTGGHFFSQQATHAPVQARDPDTQ